MGTKTRRRPILVSRLFASRAATRTASNSESTRFPGASGRVGDGPMRVASAGSIAPVRAVQTGGISTSRPFSQSSDPLARQAGVTSLPSSPGSDWEMASARSFAGIARIRRAFGSASALTSRAIDAPGPSSPTGTHSSFPSSKTRKRRDYSEATTRPSISRWRSAGRPRTGSSSNTASPPLPASIPMIPQTTSRSWTASSRW
jgi:hypothetical protein